MKTLRSAALHPVAQNVAIWLLALAPLLLSVLSTGASWRQALDSFLHSLLPACLYFALPIYTHAFFIAPLFNRQRYVLFLLLFVVNVLFWTAVVYALPRQWVPVRGVNFVLHFTMLGAVTFLAALIRIARDTVVRSQQSRQAELRLLKDQLNPHFLFNTLNNLYGLAVVKSDRLPPLMLQLSELLRYSLYETREALTPLDRELQYIRNYVDLESVRLDDRSEIHLQMEGDFSGYRIAPLLLITFVENCFKHHGSAPGARGFVRIDIRLEGHRLRLHTLNSRWPPAPETISRSSGIGLNNARQRLALLYPGRHQLELRDRKEDFAVELELDLL